MDQNELRPQTEHEQPANRAADPPRAIADERDLLQELQIKQFELDTLNDELRRSRGETRRFAEIFNLMTDGVQVCELIVDESGHPIDVLIHDVNPAYETQTGISRESVVGRRVTEILPILEPAWLLRYGELVHHKKPIAFEEYSGALHRWFRASATWIHGNRFFVVFHDITKFKQTEAAARQSETIIRSSDDAIMSKSLDGMVTSWNPGAEVMFGYSAEEMIGKKMALLFPSKRVNEEDVILARIRGGETLVQSDTTRLHKDGSEIEVSVTISPIFDQEKTIIGASNVVRNISARKRAERLLQEAETQFHAAISSLREGVVLLDRNGEIVFCNASVERIVGLSAAQMRGVTAVDTRWRAVHEDGSDVPRETHPGLVALQQGIPQRDVIMGIYKPSGELTWISVNAIVLGTEATRTGVVVTAVDITERMTIERTIQDNNKELKNAKAAAEKANLAKSEFLSSMSHELRTPLNAVLGFAQLLAAGTPPPTSEQALSIDQILKAGWHLLNLVNEILDLSLIEAGGLTLSREPVSLPAVLRDCHELLESPAREREIQMTFPSVASPIYVYADYTRLKQVMINLIANAIKYNRVGGAVTVQCLMNGENRVRVSIKDTGAGLSPTQLAQLFQPFNRLGKESGSIEGTGIGLVVTKRLVTMMGGIIGVESGAGVGTEFWVELGVASAPAATISGFDGIAATQQGRQGEPNLSPQRTLLYVEDNPANLLLVEQLIAQRSDLRMLTAVDAYLGIQMARVHHPDVILMDIHLPGLSGFGALKILREDPKTAHIPVLAISANAIAQDVAKGMEAGFFRYVTKPIKIDEFMKALDVALLYAAEKCLPGKDTVA